MNIDFLTEYYVPVIVGICLCIGFLVRSVTEKLDRYIPCICGCVGLALAIWISWGNITPATILEGLFSGLASTGLYEAFKNLINGR